jgi:3-methyl-2-oxobutanoate hydroxymethyltransferase
MTERIKKIWAPQLREMKQRGEKIAMLTAYDALMAQLFDRSGIEILLVGDSVGMVLLGYGTTIPVTLDAMVHHTAAVSRGTRRALIVADMPFLTYQTGAEEAIRNAGRLMQEGGANAVKLEGGRAILDTVRRLVESGIPVMGHLGLLPQSVNQLGGFRQQGKTEEDGRRLIEDAQALEQAGVFSIVLESIPHELAREATAQLAIPTIGIGAGPHCDGQVLVSYDALGLTEDEMAPHFAKRYASLGAAIVEAARAYSKEVKEGRFPALHRGSPLEVASKTS